ncbi:MAG: PAS domain-containing protein [Salinivirgaceae bacterium]|nr:PAS domain-containing protein [Salinivirgaceae bacterium]
MQENPSEIEILFKELLIGVTSFFRDPAVWKYMQEKALPELLQQLPNGYALRAWVPACSTGEEAYTMAIVFSEVLQNLDKNKNQSLQIFATDLDADAIELARKGYFKKNIESELNPQLLKKYFKSEGDGYRINNNIREMVVFAPQNIIKDPPFTKLNLLSCRNMLIYMEPELQYKIISLFNYSLLPEGLMLLGTSETMGNKNEGFVELDSKLKIFKRLPTHKTGELINFPSSFSPTFPMNPEKKIPIIKEENIQSITDQILLQRFAPASVLVTSDGDIIYITGRTGKYLEPVAGKANWNIHAMAREGLQQILPGAFRKVNQNYDAVEYKNIKVGSNGGTQFVNVTIQRIEKPDTIKNMIMLVFNDVKAITNIQNKTTKKHNENDSERSQELELELQHSYAEIQSTREEMQTSQEELKSINEELQSTNEELQSTNEELTTSKEEMQSLNEELQTVNIELQDKVNAYVRANDDMKNLLNSVEIATLFLDKDMNIRRFTEQATKLFKLRNADIGRPFTELVNVLNYPDLEKDSRSVIDKLQSITKDVNTNNDEWFTVRIMPYRTIDDRIDGLVITLTDITKAKKLELELLEANKILKAGKKK